MNRDLAKTQGEQILKKSSATSSIPLQREIEQAIEPLLHEEQTQQVVQRVVQIVTEREGFSGPLPHPRHMREYEEILPGSAERILMMAEKSQNYKQNMGQTVLSSSVKLSMWSMYLGAFTAILMVLGAFWSGMQGNNILAVAMLGTGTLTGVANFIYGWSKKGNE